MNTPPRVRSYNREDGMAAGNNGTPPVRRNGSRRRPGQAMRMVYEDELRGACNGRALDSQQMTRWLEIRRRLPINRWIDRKGVKNAERDELIGLRREIEEYLAIFHRESQDCPFELDMNRNYYKAAVNLMSSLPRGRQLDEKEQRILTGLMVMVDLKDARLASQILASIA